MTTAEWCILGAVLIYMFTIGPAKFLGARQYDNSAPRDPTFYSDPLRARLLGAHNNGLETFPFFAVAILVGELRHGSQTLIDGLAVGFLVIRLAYVAAYVGNRPTLRSTLWTLGFILNVLILVSPVLPR
jgi:uncharacterized MAPEG superfamily protein